MSNINSSTELFKLNALSNNTFGLIESENEIKSTVENSFNYLKDLQKSYIGLGKFSFTENDLYIDDTMKVSLSINKDFIDLNDRKDYRLSKFYNKFTSLNEIFMNPKYFSFVPLILLDGKSIFSYNIKTSLDGHTDIQFTHITEPKRYISTGHAIEVLFFRNTAHYSFQTSVNIAEQCDWEFTKDITKLDLIPNRTYFMFLRKATDITGSNFFMCKTNENGTLLMNKTDDNIYTVFKSSPNIIVDLLLVNGIVEIEEYKQINTRIDNGRMSSLFVISDDNHMPVPIENILVFKVNKNTKLMTYDINADVILHYPNIYEIMSDNLTTEYEYKIFYLYKDMNECSTYTNHFEYIHEFFMQKTKCDNLESTISKLLYTKYSDITIQNYFLSIFDYEDADYIYEHGDFFNTYKPYSFDYKVNKVKEFIEHDPYTLQRYGKRVSTPSESYYLDVSSINLDKRKRLDTSNEVGEFDNIITFDEPHYVFAFRNETQTDLDIRLFIDGWFITDYKQVRSGRMEYIYVKSSVITPKSFIEIEKFNTFKYEQKVVFESLDTEVILNIGDNTQLITPTLNDLFVTDTARMKIDRSDFKIYSITKYGEIDISDDSIYDTDRDVFKYVSISKLKLKCTNESLLNTDLYFTISKTPYLSNIVMKTDGIAKLKLFNGKVPWRESRNFVRSFVNGKMVPMDFTIKKDNPTETYFTSRAYLDAGTNVSIDISPYSYELEFSLDEIPKDFLISFKGKLSKPFDLDYYDIYLNGRKLNPHQVHMITADKIKIFNVSSRKNLYIYRKDRDEEYYGFKTTIITHVDEILNSNSFSNEDKNALIELIIRHALGNDFEINDGTDIEDDVNSILGNVSKDIYERSLFYVDVVIPQGIARPNSFFIDRETLAEDYEDVYNVYSNKKNRVVLRPNIDYDAKTVLTLGENDSSI